VGAGGGLPHHISKLTLSPTPAHANPTQYTPPLAANLSDIAQVVHAPWDVTDGGAEESAYLNQCLDYFLTSPSGIAWQPDLILFNSGMHNLGGPCTPGNGCVPGQSGAYADYAAPMAAATARLVAFAAASGGKTKLLLALTTPFLCSAATDGVIAGVLNVNASSIAAQYGLPVLDPYTAIVNKCGKAPVQSCFGVSAACLLFASARARAHTRSSHLTPHATTPFAAQETGCWCPHCPPGYKWLAETVFAPKVRSMLGM
jgi:hypothetical protein